MSSIPRAAHSEAIVTNLWQNEKPLKGSKMHWLLPGFGLSAHTAGVYGKISFSFFLSNPTPLWTQHLSEMFRS